MTHSNKSISPLRQHMVEDMTLRKPSPKTQTHYIRAVVRLTRFLDHSPDTTTAEELRLFQLHLVESGVSNVTINATLTGLKFLIEVTLDDLHVNSIEFAIMPSLELAPTSGYLYILFGIALQLTCWNRRWIFAIHGVVYGKDFDAAIVEGRTIGMREVREKQLIRSHSRSE